MASTTRKAQRAVKRPEERRRSSDTVSGLKTFAMETNDLGFVASLMFVLVPTVFLLVLYIQTSSRQG
jgi:photosystem II PsbM protein